MSESGIKTMKSKISIINKENIDHNIPLNDGEIAGCRQNSINGFRDCCIDIWEYKNLVFKKIKIIEKNDWQLMEFVLIY